MYLSASLVCNAAKAYGSGKIVPWCKIKNNIDNKKYVSATNIGYNPTFDNKNLKFETYILDFNENIYGEMIEIKFIDFIRDDIKFSDVNSLIKQMELDIEWIKNKI